MKQLLRRFFVWIIALCARSIIKKNKPFIIGVTGSVGKTSCRVIIASVLQKILPQESVYTSQKNFNSEIGLSLSILGIEDYEPSVVGIFSVMGKCISRTFSTGQYPSVLVLEYGIDKPGDMDELTSICVPDVSIITSIDSVHAENFEDGKDGIYKEKIKLLSATQDIIVIHDSIVVDDSVKQNKTVIQYSDIEGDKNSWFSNYNVVLSGNSIKSSFIYSVGQLSDIVGQNTLTITSNIVGLHNIAYISLGLTIGDIIGHRRGYTNIALEQAISFDIHLQPGRFTLFHGMNDSIIIDSTYNASSLSMKTIIGEGISLRDRFFSDYEIICVLGEMREIGESSIQEHKDLGMRLSNKIDTVIGVSGNSVHITDYLIGLQDTNKHIFRVEKNIDVVPILHSFIDKQNKKFLIIMKSSQGEIYLEEAIKPFIQKEEYYLLARQEPYRLQKKRYLHKIIE